MNLITAEETSAFWEIISFDAMKKAAPIGAAFFIA